MFRSRKQVSEYFAGDKIECLLCHKTFKAIGGQHLKKKHGISAREYKQKFGLPFSRGLDSDATSAKKITNMICRHERQDPTLNPMTKELMDKAHYSKKKIGVKRQSFTTELTKKVVKIAAKSKKVASLNRINKIDWNAFLNELESSNVAHWGLRENKNIPSWYSVKRKMDNDLNFKKRYKDITENIKLKNRYRDMILQMTSEGLSQRRISAIIGVSKSHIGRIRREQ